MSFDMTAQADAARSLFAPHNTLNAFVVGLPHVRRLGPDLFALDDPPARWMNISLEVSDPDGDSVSASAASREEINCVRFHIPYDQLGNEPERDYVPTAWAIAQFLDWRVYNQQTGEYFSDGYIPASERRVFSKLLRQAKAPSKQRQAEPGAAADDRGM